MVEVTAAMASVLLMRQPALPRRRWRSRVSVVDVARPRGVRGCRAARADGGEACGVGGRRTSRWSMCRCTSALAGTSTGSIATAVRPSRRVGRGQQEAQQPGHLCLGESAGLDQGGAEVAVSRVAGAMVRITGRESRCARRTLGPYLVSGARRSRLGPASEAATLLLRAPAWARRPAGVPPVPSRAGRRSRLGRRATRDAGWSGVPGCGGGRDRWSRGMGTRGRDAWLRGREPGRSRLRGRGAATRAGLPPVQQPGASRARPRGARRRGARGPPHRAPSAAPPDRLPPAPTPIERAIRAAAHPSPGARPRPPSRSRAASQARGVSPWPPRNDWATCREHRGTMGGAGGGPVEDVTHRAPPCRARSRYAPRRRAARASTSVSHHPKAAASSATSPRRSRPARRVRSPAGRRGRPGRRRRCRTPGT